MTDDIDLAGLLCSKLCHDLISPVGAIGNGVELLRAEGGGDGEMLGLIEDSAKAAQAALSFFRIAFGAASGSGQALTPGELATIATAHLGGARLTLALPREGDPLPRPAAKLLLLMLMAAGSAAPLGGLVTATPPQTDPLRLSVRIEGRRAGLPEGAIALIEGGRVAGAGARDSHFALLGRAARAIGARLETRLGEDRVEFSAAG